MANLTTSLTKGLPLPEGVYITKTGKLRKKFNNSAHEYSHGVCAFCGEEFIGIKQKKSWKERYCSRSCSGKSKRINKGGLSVDSSGYPCQDSKRIHVIKAESVLGRKLKTYGRGHADNEIVHHINMDKEDYRNNNLLVCTNSYHKYLHRQYELAFARSISLE